MVDYGSESEFTASDESGFSSASRYSRRSRKRSGNGRRRPRSKDRGAARHDALHADARYTWVYKELRARHGSMVARFDSDFSRRWRPDSRNAKEGRTAAVVMDLIEEGKLEDAQEVLARRVQAIDVNEETGSWNVATLLESKLANDFGSVSQARLRRARMYAEGRKKRGRRKGVVDADSDSE
jgi:hypothetical protein